MPAEFASAIERMDGQQMKRSVELMGQCVQVTVEKDCRDSFQFDAALLLLSRLCLTAPSPGSIELSRVGRVHVGK